jgi:hypothetical protein
VSAHVLIAISWSISCFSCLFGICDLPLGSLTVVGRKLCANGETDNLRYTANYCLFNESTVASTPCITSFACESFEGSLRHGNLSTTEPDFGYCDAWNDFMLEKCQECLTSLGNQQFLVNCPYSLSYLQYPSLFCL